MQRHTVTSSGENTAKMEEVDTSVMNRDQDRDFQTLLVMELSKDLQPSTIEWVMSKIVLPKNQGGCELLAQLVADEHGENSDSERDLDEKIGDQPPMENIIHINATRERLLLAAELMEIKKPYSDGSLKEISMADLDGFQNAANLDTFLTMAEKQKIILHELESVRALEIDQHVTGMPKLKLYKGEAIIPRCMKEGVIEKLFPLHDKEALKRLGHEWYRKFMSVQPIYQIRDYFGETIAMYFTFLGYYTMALIPPAVIGLMGILFATDGIQLIAFFSVFNLVWATVFLEAWKQNCAALAYKWGTINTEQFEEARPQYYGTLGINKITGRLEPQYPKMKRKLKFYFVSFPIVIFCMFVAFWVMLGYFWLQEMADTVYKDHHHVGGMCVTFIPSLIYAIVISVMNAFYRNLARALNDWENHRLQSAYDNHLIVKLVLFDFANCFMSLFWVAFYMQDMALLRSHLGTLLIVQQVIGQVREAVLPYLMFKKRKHDIEKDVKAESEAHKDDIGIEPLVGDGKVSSSCLLQARIESSKDEYDGTLDDYLEMFLQFGYVFLFSAVFPSAAFWALLNNITEIRTDAFKLCRINQRPFSQPTPGIGAWMIAFEVMSVMAVVTNCGLVALSPHVQEYVPKYGAVNIVLMFVIAEHAILAIKTILVFLIPDAPEWVETALAREDYQSKSAWRKEKLVKSEKELENQISRIQVPEKTQGTVGFLSKLAESTLDELSEINPLKSLYSDDDVTGSSEMEPLLVEPHK